MSVLDLYVIPLTDNYNNTTKEYDFQLDNAYFEAVGDSVITGGDIKVHIGIERYENGATLALTLIGTVTVPCDRCLSIMSLPISTKEYIKVVYGDHYEDNGDVLTVNECEGKINLAEIIFELTALQVPLQHAHAAGECDENMSNILKGMIVTTNE